MNEPILDFFGCDGTSLRIRPYPGSFSGLSAFSDADSIDGMKISAYRLANEQPACIHLRKIRRKDPEFPNFSDIGEMLRSSLRKNDRTLAGPCSRKTFLVSYQKTMELAAIAFLREVAQLPRETIVRILETASEK